jgi:hypothetical protein
MREPYWIAPKPGRWKARPWTPGDLRDIDLALWLEAVRLEFQELTFAGEDLVVTGFEATEIDMVLLGEETQTPEEEAADIPPLGDTAVSQPGDVWMMGEHKLIQGDARESECYEKIMRAEERGAGPTPASIQSRSSLFTILASVQQPAELK